MRLEEKTITLTYKVFDVGEIVRPTSRRCCLEPGNYTVTAYLPPHYSDSEATVFLEGQQYGVGTEYLAPVIDVHQLGEPPAGFVPLYWDEASVGQEVWLWGSLEGQPHAYGPHHVTSVSERELLNMGRQRFRHHPEDLLVRATEEEDRQ